jgi:polar amino acid transport system substrate-binding protein
MASRHGIVVFVLLLAALAPALASDPDAPGGQWRTVRIASEGARPPYNYLDNNELAGFEIDLGRALCQRMEVSCTFVTQDWDDMIPGLLASQYDAIMAAMDITAERQGKIAFTKPYVRMPSAFLARRDSTITKTSPKALAGASIGVEAGGAHDEFLTGLYEHSDIHRYSSLEDAILDLAESRVDLVIGDKDALTEFLKTRKEGMCCKLVADVPRNTAYFGAGIGIGLRKQDPELKAMFEKALDAVKSDGTFAKISSKYFDFPVD